MLMQSKKPSKSELNQAKGGRMISDEGLDKGVRTLNLIWFSMLASLVIYLLVGLHAGSHIKVEMGDDVFSLLRPGLYVLSFVTLFSTRHIRKLVQSSKSQNNKDMRPTKSLQDPILQKYTSAMVVALAMSESIAIYGILLYLFGKNPADLYILLLLSAFAMSINRPSKAEIINLSQENRGI
jgi:hypothetical protein